jgi:ABC-type bacteriocin/lantibiotic exporter with double-glycine peptidase domain
MGATFTYSPVKRLFRLLQIEKKEVYTIYFYAAMNGIIMLSLPLGIQAILNFILGGRISTSWILLVVIVVVGLAFAGFLQISTLYITEKLQQRIFLKSSFEFAYRLPKLKLESMDRYYAPELVNRFFDTVTLQKGVAKMLTDITTATLQVFFGLILLSLYHPFFIIFGLVVVTILVLIFRFTTPKGMETSLNESAAKYEVAHWLEEIARTMGTFKLAGRSTLAFDTVNKLLQKYITFREKHFRVLVTQYISMIGLQITIVGSLLIVGSVLLINDEISIGQFVAAEIIIILVLGSVEKLILSLETVYDTFTSLEKLGTITDFPIEEEKKETITMQKKFFGLKVEMENVSFRYPNTIEDIVKNVNLSIQSGEKVIITGKSGSGKSTLVQMLAGLFTEYRGRIRYNDIGLNVLNLQDLRHYIGDSLSEETIFHGTLRENITLGRDDVSEEHVWDAIEKAELNSFVNQLDEGLGTVLFPHGLKLTTAIVSKIIFARSIAAHPRLLVLEEDILNTKIREREKMMDVLTAGEYTMVAISTNEEFMQRVNRIIVMDAGNIVFDGNYENYVQFNQSNP